MDSGSDKRAKYRRFFAWAAVLAMALVIGLFGAEVIFPPEVAPPYPLGGTAESGFDLRDLQLLVMVSSLTVAAASLVGLGILTMLDSLHARKERKEDALHVGSRSERIAALAPEPANERLRALRAVASSLEETPVRKA